MNTALLILALTIGAVVATSNQCKGSYFSVHTDHINACFKSNPGKLSAVVKFADGTTRNLLSSSSILVDMCHTFQLPVGHGYPVWAKVGGFECVYGQDNEAEKNCGWEYCAEPEKKVSHAHHLDCSTADEGVILTELYYTLGGASWTRSDNWLTGTPCGNNWFGVSCDGNGRVSYLDLRKNNLVGNQIPAALGCLTFAKAINFDYNYIKGNIPDSFCQLSNIQYLTLPHNNLAGPIPTCFSNLIFLEHLYLQYNSLSGTLPDFSQYQGLKELHVEHNCLSGSIPQSLQTGSIIDMDFSSNNFDSCIPDIFQNLDVLYGGNRFCSGPLPCWADPNSAAFGCGAQTRTNQYNSGICPNVNKCVAVLSS